MYLPTLQPAVNSDSYIHGDVSIHPQAAIASGVILQASPDSQIIIEEEVCLGMGVIIHAYGGLVTVRKGAILGAGVLIMGQATIGANSCIGASTTLINTDVECQTAIAPGTLIGDGSRKVQLAGQPVVVEPKQKIAPETSPQVELSSEPVVVEPKQKIAPETSPQVELSSEPVLVEPKEEATFPSPWDIPDDSLEQKIEEETISGGEELKGEFVNQEIGEVREQKQPEDSTEVQPQPTPSTVVGKMYVNQLLVTLFPQNQNFKKA